MDKIEIIPASTNKKIVKNTVMLYFRMLVTILVTLFTSREVLRVLGVEDFGIFNVVGGVAVLFSFINSSMSAATSRFLIFELGNKNPQQLKKIFNASVLSHIAIALFVLLLAETLGLWIVTNKLVIPDERMGAAMWVYQFSVFATLISLTQVPYFAIIVAHEKMNIYVFVSIIEAALKLLIVYILTLSNVDKLIFYALLYFFVSLVVALSYRLYCKKNFPETSFSLQWEKDIYKKLLSFSIWELYGGFAVIGMGQGVNILLNMFFGPTVNAARGIAYQVQGAVAGIGDNFILASKPKIIKLFAENKINEMMRFVSISSKYSFLLTFLFTLPLLLETPFVLKIWLTTVPEFTLLFCRLVLITNLIWASRAPIVTSFHAVGKIKAANLISGSLFYLIVIFSYVFLKTGYPPESVFYVTMGVSILVYVSDLLLLKRLVSFSIKSFFMLSVFPCLLVGIVSSIIPIILETFLVPNIITFFVVCLVSVVTISIAVFFLGLDVKTRNLLIKKIKFFFDNKRGK